MCIFTNEPTKPASSGIRRRSGVAAVAHPPRSAVPFALPGLVLAVAVGFVLPATLMAQEPTPPAAPETVTVPGEVREAMERMREQRETLVQLLQELERDELFAARDLMRELRSEEDRLFGPILGLQGRVGDTGPGLRGQQGQPGGERGMMGQRGQGQEARGMQGQRGQEGSPGQGQGMQRRGQGMQGQPGQGMDRPGLQRPGQQGRVPGVRSEVGPRGQVGASVLLPGVRLHTLNPALGRYFEADAGVLVLEVVEESFLPLQGGDVIVGIDGREPEDPAHLRRILMGYRAGDTFSLELIRAGERIELSVDVPSPAEAGA